MAKTKLARFIAAHTPDVLIAPEVQQKVADLAYRFYEERGKEPGRELEDWFKAERVIRGRRP